MPAEAEEVEIVLVEDDPLDGELCIRALRAHRLANHLVWLKDGAEALEYVFGPGTDPQRTGGRRPKLMLLDLRMPKVDGFTVLKRMKSDERTKSLPIVVLTSSQEDKDVVESYRLGVNSYVAKPVEFDALCDIIAQLGLYWLLVNRAPPLAL